MDERSFISGYFFARRHAKPWKAGPRKRPKMSSGAWRLAALCCIAVGVMVALAIFRNADQLGWRLVAGGGVGFVVGMYVVETVWERRVARRSGPPGSSPIV